MRPHATARVETLRPTQITVSMAGVEAKRARLCAARQRQLEDFLSWYMIPAVLGPQNEVFVIDLLDVARALSEESVEVCYVSIEQDLSRMRPEAFWVAMERAGWANPYDEHGRRRGYSAIPRQLNELKDDPYRTLVASLRERDDIECRTVKAEFLWANFLRERVPQDLLAARYGEAVKLSHALVRSPAARHLSGWKPEG
jgi:hypothetical protein